VILTRAADAKVDLEMLVRDELRTQIVDELRLQIAGPAVSLAPKAAEVLTLALHELATNSLKYGALSDPFGRLAVTWAVTARRGALVADHVGRTVPPRCALADRALIWNRTDRRACSLRIERRSEPAGYR
jgi:two-component sensor histidine kinase